MHSTNGGKTAKKDLLSVLDTDKIFSDSVGGTGERGRAGGKE